jgi:hypothetical protein
VPERPVERGGKRREPGSSNGEGRREFPHSYVDAVGAGLGEDVGLDGLGDGLGAATVSGSTPIVTRRASSIDPMAKPSDMTAVNASPVGPRRGSNEGRA